jgi:hypothetical protein
MTTQFYDVYNRDTMTFICRAAIKHISATYRMHKAGEDRVACNATNGKATILHGNGKHETVIVAPVAFEVPSLTCTFGD